MTEPTALVVRAVETGVRPVRLRLPFRFGANTLTACPQLFVRVSVEVNGRGTAQGSAAELMVPKWFDKRAEFTPADNVNHLAASVTQAAQLYLDDTPATAFGLFARHYLEVMRAGEARHLTELSAAFGQAVIDRAIIDALCHALGTSFFEAARRNALGLCDSQLAVDMRGWDWSSWLPQLEPLRRIEARHTVGMLDELDDVHYGDDGLPISLRAVIARYGHRCFKIKLGGDPVRDLQRLRAVLAVLDSEVGTYRYTVDGNEQYKSADSLRELLAGLRALPAPLYIEQPIARELSLSTPLPDADAAAPLLMDEADGTLDAFAQGRELGWTGVSSKACKGVYKALINRARCERWNLDAGTSRYFMSAEDLTCQAGVSVQQDLALAALLGLPHSERNGHHYADGLAGSPRDEQLAFTQAHPDLYSPAPAGHPRLRIAGGVIALDSLFQPGYAHSADPDMAQTQTLDQCVSML